MQLYPQMVFPSPNNKFYLSRSQCEYANGCEMISLVFVINLTDTADDHGIRAYAMTGNARFECIQRKIKCTLGHKANKMSTMCYSFALYTYFELITQQWLYNGPRGPFRSPIIHVPQLLNATTNILS